MRLTARNVEIASVSILGFIFLLLALGKWLGDYPSGWSMMHANLYYGLLFSVYAYISIAVMILGVALIIKKDVVFGCYATLFAITLMVAFSAIFD